MGMMNAENDSFLIGKVEPKPLFTKAIVKHLYFHNINVKEKEMLLFSREFF